MNRHTISPFTKHLRTVEDIIFDLDAAITKSHISQEHLKDLEERFAPVRDYFDNKPIADDNRLFVLYEAEALLAWITGEKKKAIDLVVEATSVKGDKELVSTAARGLLASTPRKKQPQSNISPISGWLGFFYATIVVIFSSSLLIVIGNLLWVLGTDEMTSDSIFAQAIFIPLAGLSGFYLVMAARCSKKAIKAAVILMASLTAGCLFLLISSFAYADTGTDETGAAGIRLLLLFLIACGIGTCLYYLKSNRVKEIFYH